MHKKILLLLLLLYVSCSTIAKPQVSPQSFPQAKLIARSIIDIYQETIYSGCKLINAKQIDFNSCQFSVNPKKIRDSRIEFEHMLPMSHAKYHFKCWREPLCIDKNGKKFKGRNCCQQIDPKFRQLEGELYNIWPEIGSINKARSNFKFTEFNNSERDKLGNFRGLPIYIDFTHRKLEPRKSVKGLVARANLFVAKRYNIRLSGAQVKLFKAWNIKYPPSKAELAWAKKIYSITGVENEYISKWQQCITNS